MLFAETIVQIDATALVGAFTAAAGIIGTAIGGAARYLVKSQEKREGTTIRLHNENRKDREALQVTMNQQWELLSRLAQTSRVTEQRVKDIQDNTPRAKNGGQT